MISFKFVISVLDSHCDDLPQVRKKPAIPLVISIQLYYCLNIMTNSYDTVSYMLPCLSAWIHCGCVNDITVHVTLLHSSFCLRDVMLLSIMMVSVLLDFKIEGYWIVKGFSNLRLILQAIIYIITTEERHHLIRKTLRILIRIVSEFYRIFSWHFDGHINQKPFST